MRTEESAKRGRNGSEWRKSSELKKGTVEDRGRARRGRNGREEKAQS
jgi:hypothetical protein